jgi:hypothetical protein
MFLLLLLESDHEIETYNRRKIDILKNVGRIIIVLLLVFFEPASFEEAR